METSPGWAVTSSAINLAAGVSTATPCAKQPFSVKGVGHVSIMQIDTLLDAVGE